MRKFCFRLFGWILLLSIVLTIATLIGYSRLPDIASKYLSKHLKVAVTIEDIHLSSDEIEIDNIEISNIPGSILSKALSVQKTIFKAPLKTYIKNKILIDKILLDDIYLGLEFESSKSTEGNWSTLMTNLQSNQKSSSEKTKETEVIIKELVLTNIRVEIVYKQEGSAVKKLAPIDRIVLKNISSKEGIPSDQITKIVLNQMLKSVFSKENLKNMLEGVLEEPKTNLETILQPFKNLFSKP